jgi:hypothetical protein
MAERKGLRVVQPDEKPKPQRRRKLTVTQAAEKGTPRDLLVAMRDRVAKDVESLNTPARDLAALTRRLIEITKEIEAIDAAGEEGDGNDPTPDEGWDAEAL